MADYIKAIRTKDGDKQIDYESLANKPDKRFEDIENQIGEFGTALEELHAYAQGLINGGDA